MAPGNTANGLKQTQMSLPEGHRFVIIKLNVGSMVAVETSQLREAVRHRDVTVPSHALFKRAIAQLKQKEAKLKSNSLSSYYIISLIHADSSDLTLRQLACVYLK